MKKTILMLMAVVGITSLVACGNKTDATQNGATDSAAVKNDTTQVATPAATETPSLADLVAKAKAEGANWSVDEWKEQVKQALLAIKPMAVAVDNLTKKIGTPEAQNIDFEAEMKKIQEQYPDIDSLLDEFNKVAESCANGKAVLDDEEWGNKTKAELGVPDL